MSKNERRIPLERAKMTVGEIIDIIAPVCNRIEIAGSIRREKPTVGDGELVVIAENKSALWGKLDKLVYDGIISKARYVDKNGKVTLRWGDKYRGIFFDGMKIEIFTAMPEGWGLQFLLRTGPDEANKHIVFHPVYQGSNLKFEGGYGWHIVDGKKILLNLECEKNVYACLGMPFIEPKARSAQTYANHPIVIRDKVLETLHADDEHQPKKQRSLF